VETADKDPTEADALRLDSAARESDTEEYEGEIRDDDDDDAGDDSEDQEQEEHESPAVSSPVASGGPAAEVSVAGPVAEP
jgi:hypothetical protein